MKAGQEGLDEGKVAAMDWVGLSREEEEGWQQQRVLKVFVLAILVTSLL
jgi:hypothetical protein